MKEMKEMKAIIAVSFTIAVFLAFFAIMGSLGCSNPVESQYGVAPNIPRGYENEPDGNCFTCPPKRRCLFNEETGKWEIIK